MVDHRMGFISILEYTNEYFVIRDYVTQMYHKHTQNLPHVEIF